LHYGEQKPTCQHRAVHVKRRWKPRDVMESGSQIEAWRETQENDHKKHHVRREKELGRDLPMPRAGATRSSEAPLDIQF